MCQQSAATPHTHVGVSKPEPMLCFFCVELCRRKSCSERAAVFTFGVTDWATACRTRTERQQKDPPSSPSRPRRPCTTGTRFTSASWIGPSASTPYPERFSRSASSSSTSSTGSPTKCCGTRTSTQTCEAQNQNCLSDTNWRGRRAAHLPRWTGALNFVLRGVFRISAWPQAGLLFLRGGLIGQQKRCRFCPGERHRLEF